jgi:hypothetical protein
MEYRSKSIKENSCVLQPTFKNKFQPKAAEVFILDILKEELAELTYDQDKCSGMCKNLCDKIKMKLRSEWRPLALTDRLGAECTFTILCR